MKDPVKLKIWCGFIAILLFLVPWYWPKESTHTIVGIPAWAFFIMVFLVALVIYINFIIGSQWDIERYVARGADDE